MKIHIVYTEKIDYLQKGKKEKEKKTFITLRKNGYR